ncbi:MAG TPA: flagellar hook capping FlgD N-terminal domain-containing protein [Actinomycetales bacterium]|nr:flagellar hook capping FlgD N-terminal domain-containing protein [Actinomycetales bacterium]
MPDAITSHPVVSSISDLMTAPKQVTSPNPNGELGKDAFLKLLVAQLKYQDPSSPVDSSQFMAQTAAFTQVEKLQAMAADSSASLALQQGLAASSLVGRTVSYVDADGVTRQGVVSSASFGGSGSSEPVVHIGTAAVPLSSIVEVTSSTTPTPATDGDGATSSTTGATPAATDGTSTTPTTTTDAPATTGATASSPTPSS